jgi:arylsulfatase A-like enzyme
MTALRCGDWKIVYRHRTLALELYNLAQDLSERCNLAQSHPQKLAQMAALMTAELKEKGALMPKLRATGQPIPYPDQLIKQE